MAFFAEKPFVHVKILPSFKAVCSTGKLKVSPSGSAGSTSGSISSIAEEPANGLEEAVVGETVGVVRNASTESAK